MTKLENKYTPAYPVKDLSENQATGEVINHQYVFSGLTKREFVAIEILKVLIQSNPFLPDEEHVRNAYKFADAFFEGDV